MRRLRVPITSLAKPFRIPRCMVVTALSVAASVLTCGDQPNPFADLSNARAVVVKKSFHEAATGDSISIFSPESLWFVIALREEVDSVVFEAPESYLGTRIVFSPDDDSWATTAHKIASFSFFEPGIAAVSLKTYRSDGTQLSEAFRIKAFSPLKQASITGYQGLPVRLEADSVPDPTALYNWQFSKALTVSLVRPRTDTTIRNVRISAGTGALFLTDFHGQFRSPSVPFTFSFSDTSGPRISLPGGSDTILTADSILVLTVQVTDDGTGFIDRVELDGAPMTPTLFNGHYQGTITNVPAAAYQSHLVTAYDSDENRTTRIVYVRRDTLGPVLDPLMLSIIWPATDTLRTTSDQVVCLGSIDNLASDSTDAILKIVRDGIPLDSIQVRGTHAVAWEYEFAVENRISRITLNATDFRSQTSKSLSFIVLVDTIASDTIPPVIATVSIDGYPADQFHSVADSVKVRVIAFDEGSGIDTLKVNGTTLSHNPDKRYVWQTTVRDLEHSLFGNPLNVVAKDVQGNSTHSRATVYVNTPPRLLRLLPPTTTIRAGTTYRDSLEVFDAEYDSVSVRLIGPDNLTMDGSMVSWTPAQDDIGRSTLVMYLSDAYQTSRYTFDFLVIPAENSPCSLSVSSRFLKHSGERMYLSTSKTDTLRFTIHDPDSSLFDRHTVHATYQSISFTKVLDTSRTFSIVANSLEWGDSIVVHVEDIAAHRDTLVLYTTKRSTGPVDTSSRSIRYAIEFASPPFQADLNEPIVRFPLLVRLDSTFDFSTHGEISFRTTSGKQFPFEVERWDSLGQTAEIWVQVDTILAHGFPATVFLEVDTTKAFAEGQAWEVFDTSMGYRLVYHLDSSQADTGAAGVYRNSAMDGFDGNDYVVSDGKQGVIGRGQDISATKDFLDIGQPDFPGRELTLSCWFKLSASLIFGRIIYKESKPYQGTPTWGLSIQGDALLGEVKIDGTKKSIYSPQGVVVQDQWMYGVFSFDGTTLRLYHYGGGGSNGLSNSMEFPGTIDPEPSVPAIVGNSPDDLLTLSFMGSIDEVRVSAQSRSSEWIHLCYLTQHPSQSILEITKVP